MQSKSNILKNKACLKEVPVSLPSIVASATTQMQFRRVLQSK